MIKFNTDTRILLLLAACIELWSAKRELIKVNAETNHLIVSQVSWCSLNLCLVYSWFGTIHFGHKIVSYLCFMDVFAVFRKWSNYCLTPFKQLSLCDQYFSLCWRVGCGFSIKMIFLCLSIDFYVYPLLNQKHHEWKRDFFP